MTKSYPACCPSGKIRYLTAEDAERAAIRLFHEKDEIHTVYQCPHCANWHRTHAIPERKPKPKP
jgi:hypothetical protein